jgi:PncC family amidohydrolase
MSPTLEEQVGQLLRSRGQTVAVGESCTGGLVGHRITGVPGSSEYFLGSLVAYSYEAKERLLGVRHETLYAHGAVSRETVVEMARGARSALGADVGVGVTGIAGPGGGMPGKPVGLVWVAVSTRRGEWSENHQFNGDREANKARAADAALGLVVRVLEAEA